MEQSSNELGQGNQEESANISYWDIAKAKTFYGLFEYAGIVIGVGSVATASNYKERILGGVVGGLVFAYGRFCSSFLIDRHLNSRNLESTIENNPESKK